MKRLVKYTGFESLDHQIEGQYFPNNTRKFSVFKPFQFHKNMDNITNGYEIEKPDPWDTEATLLVRNNLKHLHRDMNQSWMYHNAISIREDGCALLLPSAEDGNKTGYDFLTYRSSLYRDVAFDIFDKLAKKGFPLTELCGLIVDYSACQPYTNLIRHGSPMQAKQEYAEWKLRAWADAFEPFLLNAFNGPWIDHVPPLKGTKSMGPPYCEPSGVPFDKQATMYPDEVRKTHPYHPILRPSTREVKLRWLNSKQFRENIETLLSHCESYAEPSYFADRFIDFAVDLHSIGYRMNNYDPLAPELLNDYGGDIRKLQSLFECKSRPGCLEIEPCIFQSFIQDSKKMHQMARSHGINLVLNKARAMFPGPIAAFSLPGIFLFRHLFKNQEETCHGIPNWSDTCMGAYDLWHNKYSNRGVQYVSFDRSTSEQMLTENCDVLVKLWPKKIADFIMASTTAVLPSNFGPRVVRGAVASGTHSTTVMNMMAGNFDFVDIFLMSNGITEQSDWIRKMREYVSVFFSSDPDCVWTVGEAIVPVKSGLDDQNQPVFGRFKWDNELAKRRFLNGGVTDDVVQFGLHFTKDGVRKSSSNSIAKIFLSEKTTYGDRIAKKIWDHLQMVPEAYDPIQEVFDKYKLGSLLSYKKGADAFEKCLDRYGVTAEPIWDIESPKDRIIYSREILEFENDPLNKYPVENIASIYAMFKSYFNGSLS